jgi:hypothetical protein
MTLQIINQRLADIYGITNDGNPRFRLVLASEQIEKKIGTFREYVKGTNILLREFTGCKPVPKYWYTDAVYVLERYVKEPFLDIYPASDCPVDTPKEDWSGYEPFLAFDSQTVKNGLHTTLPSWKAVNFVIKTNLFLERRIKGETETENSLRAEEEKQLIQEKLLAYEQLQDIAPELPSRLVEGTAVVVPKDIKNE